MLRLFTIASALIALALCGQASAHPVPFSYVDVRLDGRTAELTIVVHTFDAAHDLDVQPPESLLDTAVLVANRERLNALIAGRLRFFSDGKLVTAASWAEPEALATRQSVQVKARYDLPTPPGQVDVAAVLFPYDPNHKTFLNFYEGQALAAQAILDKDRSRFEYFAGTRQGVRAVLAKFVPSGIHHILIGPDHLLFLVGLLLMGGTIRQLLLVVTAFTIAHSITLSLAALNLVLPPAALIEPAIALSVVYVGADNLLVSGGRDMRAWIAFAFGLIHGFGFANVLREMDLPARALGWTLFGFNFGVELGQLIVVILVASALAWIRSRSEIAGRRLALAGSIAVIAAGAFWFVQRVFFSGGTA